MPKQFVFCRVCRHNHDQGKGHKYCLKHVQKRDELLSKVHRKVQEVVFFLKNATRLRHDQRLHNKFWCYFCEQEVVDRESVFACANIIRHLAGAGHLAAVKAFWREHGGEMDKQRLFSVPDGDVRKWEAACDRALQGGQDLSSAAPVSEARSEQSRVCTAVNKDQDLVQHHDSVRDADRLSADPLASCSTQSHMALVTGVDQTQHVSRAQQEGAPPVHRTGSTIQQSMNDLTSIRLPRLHVIGNVHTGAPPPWLSDKESAGTAHGNSEGKSTSAVLSRSQERKLAKMNNSKRVGAAWAEQRRAELQREQDKGKSTSLQRDASWLPKFGRVWQSGSRRDTRREFEAEKQVGEKHLSPPSVARTTELKPYVSKRKRQEDLEV